MSALCSHRHYPLVAFSLIVLLAGLSAATLVSVLAPALGYEESIYLSTPLWYWLIAGIAAATGLGIILHAIRCGEVPGSTVVMAGIVSLLAFRFLATLLPLFRGYFTWSGDNLSNLGHVVDILSLGRIGEQNPYPVAHIIVAEISLLTGIPPTQVAMIVTGAFSSIFVLGVYLLSRTVFAKRRDQFIALLIAALLLFNDYEVFFRPNAWAFLLVPLILALFIRSRSSLPHSIMLLPFVIGVSLLHPVAALALVVSFLVIASVQRLRTRDESVHFRRAALSSAVVPSLIILSVLLPWTLAFQSFQRDLRRFVTLLIEGGEGSPVAGLATTLARIDLGGIDVLLLYLRWFGEETLLVAAALVGLVLLFRNRAWLFGRRGTQWSRFLAFWVIVSLSAISFLVYFFGAAPGLDLLGMERSQRYLVLFLPLLVTPFASYLIRREKRSSFVAFFVVILIVASSVSIAGLYHSPWIKRPNSQVSVAEANGLEWLFTHKDESRGIATILTSPQRFAHLLYGVQGAATDLGPLGTSFLPDHFGYDLSGSASGLSKDSDYIVIAESERITYLRIWESAGRFHPEDFARLLTDASLQHIYANGEIDVFLSAGP